MISGVWDHVQRAKPHGILQQGLEVEEEQKVTGWIQGLKGSAGPQGILQAIQPASQFCAEPVLPEHNSSCPISLLNNIRKWGLRAKCNIDFNLKLQPSSVHWIECLSELPGVYLGNTTNNNRTLCHNTQPEKEPTQIMYLIFNAS